MLLRDLFEEYPFFPMNIDPKNARNVEPILEIIREYKKVRELRDTVKIRCGSAFLLKWLKVGLINKESGTYICHHWALINIDVITGLSLP